MQLISPFERDVYESAMKQGMHEGRQQGIQEGRQEGIQQGIQEGIQLGEAQLLINLLKTKFNGLPEDYLNKISSADIDTLNRWGINILKAQSLDEVFN